MEIRSICFFVLLTALTIGGCTTTQPQATQNPEAWLASLLGYEESLPKEHPDKIENLLKLPPSVTALVRERFVQKNKHSRAKALTEWLLDEHGHNMVYDLTANLSPSQAFEYRRGNCLSFTILLVRLANELEVELQYNDVDLPNTWDQDEQAGLILYRHVNAIYKSPAQTQVFDLAIQDYDAAFPQRTISERSAGALLHSNLGIDALKQADMPQAFHHLKLAVSLDPENSYLWINLGVIYKRSNNYSMAEKIFKIAAQKNDANSLAASSLERLYREQGRDQLAKKLQKRSARARAKNPYVQFKKANTFYQNEQFKQAFKALKRAISLHDTDPAFFELRSRINQHFERYKRALIDLGKAFELAKTADDRKRYYNKVKRVAKLAEQERQKRNMMRIRFITQPQF